MLIIFCYLNSFLYPSHHHTHNLPALYQCPPSPLCPFVRFCPCVCLTESNIRCRECNQTTLERAFNRREGKVFLSFYCTSHCDNKHAFDTKAQTCTVWASCRGMFPCRFLLHRTHAYMRIIFISALWENDFITRNISGLPGGENTAVHHLCPAVLTPWAFSPLKCTCTAHDCTLRSRTVALTCSVAW